MEDRVWLHPVLLIAGLIVGAFLTWYLIGVDYRNTHSAKTVTVEETVREQPINNNKTVPLKETHTENNHYYTQPCKLPNTGGEQ